MTPLAPASIDRMRSSADLDHDRSDRGGIGFASTRALAGSPSTALKVSSLSSFPARSASHTERDECRTFAASGCCFHDIHGRIDHHHQEESFGNAA